MPSPTVQQRYTAAIQFLADRTNYERSLTIPPTEEAFHLGRMRELLERIGNPQQAIPAVHIAGTKGKGSTAAMIASILTAAGYRVGLFTSPHIDHVEERIAIHGRPCEPMELASQIERLRPIVEALDREAQPEHHGPTYFEILTAAAWLHFLENRADIVVLEVGLGGRLDATTVCKPALTIITSISFDHVKQLGDTLGAIAAEKAGILKPGVPVISGVTEEEPREVIRRIAGENGSPLRELGEAFRFDYRPPQHLERTASSGHLDYFQSAPAPLLISDIPLNLPGRHQAANAAIAVMAIEELRRSGWTISETAMRQGIAKTDWPARVEVISRQPTIVLDAAHNAASVHALLESLTASFSARRRILLFATTQDKDLRGMLDPLLAAFDEIIFTRYLGNLRSVSAEELMNLSRAIQSCETDSTPGRFQPRMHLAPTPKAAWELARRITCIDDLLCITGSFFFAAEMRREIAEQPHQEHL